MSIRRQQNAALEAVVLRMSSANVTCSPRPTDQTTEPAQLRTHLGNPQGRGFQEPRGPSHPLPLAVGIVHLHPRGFQLPQLLDLVLPLNAQRGPYTRNTGHAGPLKSCLSFGCCCNKLHCQGLLMTPIYYGAGAPCGAAALLQALGQGLFLSLVMALPAFLGWWLLLPGPRFE